MATNFKCEDLMGAAICNRLRQAMEHLKVEIKKHFFPTFVGDVLDAVKCEDVLAADVCTKLREIAKTLKIKIELVDQIIRQLVKEKITEAKVIIAKVKAKLIEMAKNFKCSDILNAKVL